MTSEMVNKCLHGATVVEIVKGSKHLEAQLMTM